MRPSSFVSTVVLVSALALLVTACGGGGESRPPTTTVQADLVATSEEEPVQLDEAGGDDEEDADGAAVEIAEGMDAQEAAFGEGEEFEGEREIVSRGVLPTGLEIEAIVAHERGQLMRRGRSERADHDFDRPPFPRPIGSQIATDTGAEFCQQTLVEDAGGEFFGQQGRFQAGDALGEMRR